MESYPKTIKTFLLKYVPYELLDDVTALLINLIYTKPMDNENLLIEQLKRIIQKRNTYYKQTRDIINTDKMKEIYRIPVEKEKEKENEKEKESIEYHKDRLIFVSYIDRNIMDIYIPEECILLREVKEKEYMLSQDLLYKDIILIYQKKDGKLKREHELINGINRRIAVETILGYTEEVNEIQSLPPSMDVAEMYNMCIKAWGNFEDLVNAINKMLR